MNIIVRTNLWSVAVLFGSTLAAAEDKPLVREIPAKDAKVYFGGGIGESTIKKPQVIASSDELAKIKPLEKGADSIGKQVDFSKEKIVFFFWGSFDRQVITPDPEKPGTFAYTTKLSKSSGFMTHAKLFVVPKDAEVKVTETKK